jgi:hypothetical protein
MRKRLMICCAVALAAGLAMWTCSKNNPTGSGDGGGSTIQTLTLTAGYTVSGNYIILSFPQDISTHAYCAIDSLVTYYDTSLAYDQALSFVLDGNVLKLAFDSDTAVFIRAGIASGLQGQWSLSDTSIQGGSVMLYITANTLTITETYIDCYADDWMLYDWAYDSAGFNGTAAELSCTQVRITGNTTGEQVTITWNNNGDMTYTSTDAAHAAYTYYQNPTSCPDDYSPDWYYSYPDGFFYSNQSAPAAAAKRAIRPSVPRIKKHQKFLLFR